MLQDLFSQRIYYYFPTKLFFCFSGVVYSCFLTKKTFDFPQNNFFKGQVLKRFLKLKHAKKYKPKEIITINLKPICVANKLTNKGLKTEA